MTDSYRALDHWVLCDFACLATLPHSDITPLFGTSSLNYYFPTYRNVTLGAHQQGGTDPSWG